LDDSHVKNAMEIALDRYEKELIKVEKINENVRLENSRAL